MWSAPESHPAQHLRALLGSALLGAATGGRTFSGLAALTLTTPPAPRAQPDRTLAATKTKAGVGLAAVQELLLDKWSRTPSRLEPPALLARAVLAAANGVIVARRTDAERSSHGSGLDAPAGSQSEPARQRPGARAAYCSLVATLAALGTSRLGVRWRSRAATRLGADWIGAVLEDIVVVTVATIGSRVSRPV